LAEGIPFRARNSVDSTEKIGQNKGSKETESTQGNPAEKLYGELHVTCRIGEKYVQITTLGQVELKTCPLLSRTRLELAEAKACHEKVTKLKKQFAAGHNTCTPKGNTENEIFTLRCFVVFLKYLQITFHVVKNVLI